MNIAGQITADAFTFARTCTGLGYEKSNIERGLVSSFSLTPEQAAVVTTKVIAGNTTDQEV
jgi:hypothetical protein